MYSVLGMGLFYHYVFVSPPLLCVALETIALLLCLSVVFVALFSVYLLQYLVDVFHVLHPCLLLWLFRPSLDISVCFVVFSTGTALPTMPVVCSVLCFVLFSFVCAFRVFLDSNPNPDSEAVNLDSEAGIPGFGAV